MSLTVVTLTQHKFPQWLELCQQSVAAAMPEGGKHVIVECPRDQFARIRYETAVMDEYVCYVDDDDLIDPKSLKVCLKALQTTNATAVCTNEVWMHRNGQLSNAWTADKTWERALSHPKGFHHLCMWKSSAVDPRALELDAKYGVGIDWFIKMSAALNGDALHVPLNGYFWRQHDTSLSRSDPTSAYTDMAGMSTDMQALWGKRSGKMDKFPQNLW